MSKTSPANPEEGAPKRPPDLRVFGEVAAVVGVLVSLVFIGLELRHNAIAARAAAYQEMGIAISDTWLATSTDRELAAALASVSAADASSISDLEADDLRAARNHLTAVLRLYETTYLLVEEGLLESDALESLGWGTLNGNPFLVLLWPDIRQRVSPEFAAYLESSGALVPD